MSVITRSLTAATFAAAVVGAVPCAAHASTVPARRQTQQLDCSGLGSVTIVNPPDATEDTWSAAQIVGDGHLVPVSFTYRVEDVTLGVVLDEDTVTHAPAHHRQDTVTYTSESTATLADLLPVPPGVELPAAAQPTDEIAFVFEATAVPLPSAS